LKVPKHPRLDCKQNHQSACTCADIMHPVRHTRTCTAKFRPILNRTVLIVGNPEITPWKKNTPPFSKQLECLLLSLPDPHKIIAPVRFHSVSSRLSTVQRHWALFEKHWKNAFLVDKLLLLPRWRSAADGRAITRGRSRGRTRFRKRNSGRIENAFAWRTKCPFTTIFIRLKLDNRACGRGWLSGRGTPLTKRWAAIPAPKRWGKDSARLSIGGSCPNSGISPVVRLESLKNRVQKANGILESDTRRERRLPMPVAG